MTINIKEYEDGERGFDIADLLKGTTTRLSTVKYYSVECVDNKLMIIVLYNKNKRKIKLREKI